MERASSKDSMLSVQLSEEVVKDPATLKEEAEAFKDLPFLKRNFTAAAFVYGLLIYSKNVGYFVEYEHGEEDEHTTTMYKYAGFIFGLTLIFDILGYMNAANPRKRFFSTILICVNTTATFTYVCMAFRLTPTLIDFMGNQLEIVRYLEWLFTCPCLILLMNELTQPKSHAIHTMVADYLVVIFGLVASYSYKPRCYLYAFLSYAFFCYVIYNMWKWFTDAINSKDDRPINRQSLSVIRFQSIACWSFFAVSWSFPLFMNMGPNPDVWFCLPDIGAKVLFSMVLVSSNVEQMQNLEVDRLNRFANELKGKMANSEKLLNTMMPPDVVQRLRDGKEVDAEEYECVTIFFSDIANFTVLSSKTPTNEMMRMLNRLWLKYDTIARKNNVYKIETIGDAFLGVSGCPSVCKDHAENVAQFALDILDMVKDFRTEDGQPIHIRIGIHSGPVTAGVLGDLCPHYALVGDSVNTASRMESNSEAMKIHISEATYKLIKHRYKCEARPPMEIKGKGVMQTYWLLGAADANETKSERKKK
eukprot:Colp12_sorted_trinity150504_noHs@28177